MNGYRKFNWLVVLMSVVGSMMVPHVASGAEAQFSSVISSRQNDLQDCGRFDTNCDDDDEGAPRYEYELPDDSCTGYNCDDDDEGAPRYEYELPDDSCTGYNCDDDDDGLGTSSDDCRGLRCDDEDDDEGAPGFEYESPEQTSCSDGGYARDLPDYPLDLSCEDDPWNGSTTGCSTYGGGCDDDSYLIECSYVTAPTFGPAEGACDKKIGQSRFVNCFPVSGPANTYVYDTDPHQQTFRCSENRTTVVGGYTITDVDPLTDADVVLILCSPEPGMFSSPDEDSCEDPPRRVKYLTCEIDNRFLAPMGSDGEWYLCAK
jgi:hypothetical protein